MNGELVGERVMQVVSGAQALEGSGLEGGRAHERELFGRRQAAMVTTRSLTMRR
jgi:hypothetical protein